MLLYVAHFQDDVGATQADLLGVEDGARRSFFASKPAVKNRVGIFAMGMRAAVLGQLEAPVCDRYNSC